MMSAHPHFTPQPTIKPKIEDQELDFVFDTGAAFSPVSSSLSPLMHSICQCLWVAYVIAHNLANPNISWPLKTHHAFLVSNCPPSDFYVNLIPL